MRVIAFGLLVLYHVGMYYVSWGWHVKSVHAGKSLEPLMRFLPCLRAYTGVLWLARRGLPAVARAQLRAAVAGACLGWGALLIPAALLRPLFGLARGESRR